jgi:peptidoglycan/LPS O-acetylase OafA/YrhL
MSFLTETTHLHITTWVIALILFFVAVISSKKLTAVHMTLRLFYILVIVSGALLFFEYRDLIVKIHDSGMIYDMKFLFGILLIGGMEMVLVGKNKGKKPIVGWIIFAVSLVAVLLLGTGFFGTTIGIFQ